MITADRTIGNYVLGACIGRGGTSEVYAATHRDRGEAVAVKVLHPHLVTSELATTAFLAEGSRTQAIDHPNVVRVIESGSDAGRLFLVMERLSGESLATRLREVGSLPEAEVRRLGAAIADGMHAAHALGIVHRDLKPGNIMLDADDAPTIIDFGIARSLDTRSALTTGSLVGTPAYMAPEQLTHGVIAPCVDIWALGVTLFEAITGRLPFTDFAAGRLAQLLDPIPRPSELVAISPRLEALLLACLASDRSRRPASMADVARALRDAGDPDRITELAIEPPRSQPRPAALASPIPQEPARRHWRPLVALGGVLLAGGVGVAVWVSASSGESRASPAAAPRTEAAAVDAGLASPAAADAGPETVEVEVIVPIPRSTPPPRAKPARPAKPPGPKPERRGSASGESLD